MARTIVLGYDGSEGAHVALEKAIEVAQLEAARIVIVFAAAGSRSYNEHDLVFAEELARRASTAMHNAELFHTARKQRERAEEATARAVPRLDESGLEYAIELVPERPTEGLVDIADKTGASMIVVGTNGEHPIKGVVLGSVPHKLLHVSDVPVLVVPTSK